MLKNVKQHKRPHLDDKVCRGRLREGDKLVLGTFRMTSITNSSANELMDIRMTLKRMEFRVQFPPLVLFLVKF